MEREIKNRIGLLEETAIYLGLCSSEFSGEKERICRVGTSRMLSNYIKDRAYLRSDLYDLIKRFERDIEFNLWEKIREGRYQTIGDVLDIRPEY